MKPFNENCEQNKLPIQSVLEQLLTQPGLLLELAAGTGQHAVHFASVFPHVQWQPSDRQDMLAGMQMWVDDSQCNNLLDPLPLDVCQSRWPEITCQYVYSANSTHIMSWPEVECMFDGVGSVLQANGLFINYGPFNFDNQFTSESNRQFDSWLRQRDPQSGVRNFEDLDALAMNHGMRFAQTFQMPVNNFVLVWEKR